MSVEITLYTKKSTKNSLMKFLISEGFQRAKHFFPELGSENQYHFMWFSFDDHESSAGVEASVHKASDEEVLRFHCSEWILHTRTRASGSYEDKKKQNEVIRRARKEFSGSFYNDWYGVNRYTDLADYQKFTPLEKSISGISENSLRKLSQIKQCLDGYTNELSNTIAKIEFENLRDSLVLVDPSIILLN